MGDDAVSIDPDGLRTLGDEAATLAGGAESVRLRVGEIVLAGDLFGIGAPLVELAELAEELDLLAVLCEERAAAIENAGTGWLSPFAGLEASLNDGRGSDGMTNGFALETLRVHRRALDTDDDGEVSEEELVAAASSSDPSVRAAASWFTGDRDPYGAAATAGQLPGGVFGGVLAPLGHPDIEEQLETINARSPAELEVIVTGWTVDTVDGQRGVAYTVTAQSVPLDPSIALGAGLFADPGPTTLVVEPQQIAVPDLDGDWLAALGDLAPEGTAAMVLVYREEEVNFAYTVDPIPPLPEAVDNVVWAGSGGLAGVAALGSSLAARLNPIGVGASIAVGAYQFVDWVTPDAEPRQDTTAIFDVEYRDAEGNLLEIETNMAVLREEVSGPLFAGPAIVVLPYTAPKD